MDAFDLHDRTLWYSYGQNDDDDKYVTATFRFKAIVSKEVTVTIPKEELSYKTDSIFDNLSNKLDDFYIEDSDIYITDMD